MFAQPSQSAETYTRYRESSDGEGGAGEVNARDGLATQENDAAPESSSSQLLLQEVLSETLVRHQENAEQLVDALRCFHDQHSDQTCDEQLFVLIVREVLRHRLGQRAAKLPKDLFDEVGRALWANEQSRQRVQQLWESLGAGS